MKNRVFKSFQLEIIIYSGLSLIYTIVTEIFIAILGIGVYRVIKSSKDKEKITEFSVNSNRTNEILMDDTMAKGSSLNDIFIEESFVLELEDMGFTQSIESSFLHENIILLIIIGSLLIGILLFITYFLILSKKFTYSLKEISYGMTQLSEGNFEHSIQLRYNNEFGVIANEINAMAHSLKEIMDSQKILEEEKNYLITSVAHDLRTPLTSILGYLDLVLNNKSISDDIRHRYTEIAFEKTKRLDKLIDDLFTYTTYNFTQVSLDTRKIDMVKFMEQMVEEFYPTFVENKLEHEFISNVCKAQVIGDGDLLARAFSNILDNAIKYGREGKCVIIEITRVAKEVIVIITNYGRSIEKEELNKIFERFYRIEHSRSGETGGAGIGLAIVKRVIDLHHGRLEVSSDHQGTVFKVILEEFQEL